MHPVSCTNFHHDVTDSTNQEMVKNKFLANRTELFLKIKKMCFRWRILRGYRFVGFTSFCIQIIFFSFQTNQITFWSHERCMNICCSFLICFYYLDKFNSTFTFSPERLNGLENIDSSLYYIFIFNQIVELIPLITFSILSSLWLVPS